MSNETSTGTYEGRTAAQWREAAQELLREVADSFERSDTDGFLSQWAGQMLAREAELKAYLAERGGRTEFPALFDLDGNRVAAERVQGQYGESWRVFDPETHRTLGYFNESNARSEATRRANNAKKGYYVGTVEAAARVEAGNRSYFTTPADRYMADVTVIDNGK